MASAKGLNIKLNLLLVKLNCKLAVHEKTRTYIIHNFMDLFLQNPLTTSLLLSVIFFTGPAITKVITIAFSTLLPTLPPKLGNDSRVMHLTWVDNAKPKLKICDFN